MKNKKKILIIGSGSIALKHYNILKKSYDVFFFTKNKTLKKKININKIYDDWNEATESNYLFAVIANSTDKHIKSINNCIKKGINIYCEKPIFHKNFNYKILRNQISNKKIFFICGYHLRQNKKIKYIKKQIKNDSLTFQLKVGHDILKWRNQKPRVNSYYIYTKKGGGCLNELVHEINLIQFLFGKIEKIETFNKRTRRFNFKCEEFSTSILRTQKKQIGTLYQDIFSPIFFRSLTILCKNKLYEYDFVKDQLKLNSNEIKFKDKSLQVDLIKDNLDFFVKLIKKRKFTLQYFDESIQDMLVVQKMYDKKI